MCRSVGFGLPVSEKSLKGSGSLVTMKENTGQYSYMKFECQTCKCLTILKIMVCESFGQIVGAWGHHRGNT